MRHLSRWILLLLPLFTSCTHNEVLVETCKGETASFQWDYKVPPFYAVEWYFGKTLIAKAFEDPLSQDSLRINGSYKSRFVLLEEDKIGFNLTNVTRGDDGDYKCIVNLRSTSVRVKKKGTLNVTEPECLRVKRASDAGEQKCTCTSEDEQRPATDSSGTANPVAVAVPVVIVIVIAAVAVVVFRKKCKSTGENQNVRSEVENGMVSQGLTQQEDSAV